MKVSGLLVAAVAGLLGFSALSAQAAPVELDLTLQVNTATQTWTALGQITGATSSTAGLAGVEITVAGSGGAVVNTSKNVMPSGTDLDNGSSSGIGAGKAKTPGAANPDGVNLAGYQILGAQSTSISVDSGGFTNMFLGIGLTAVSTNPNPNMFSSPASLKTWGLPVILATGTYTGNAGSLTVSGKPTDTTLLPLADNNGVALAVTMAASEDGAGIATFSPDTVTGQTFSLGGTATPEPASLGVLGLGSLLVLRRRRSH